MSRRDGFKVKKILCIAICVVILLSLSSFAVIYAANYLGVKVPIGDGHYETILPKGDTYYLPSGIDIDNVQMTDGLEYSYIEGNRRISSADGILKLSEGKTTDSSGNPCYVVYITYGGATKKCTFYVGLNIGNIYLSTSMGMQWIHSYKENKDENVTAVITDKEGKVIYDGTKDKNSSSLKGRGNASWGYNKKSYNLKIGTKTDLFGMGKSKKWVLMANYIDPSFLRNYVAYSLALGIGLGNSSKSAYVNLYIDGEYYGLYQLLEKVEIGKERVNITDLEEIMEDMPENDEMGSYGTTFVQSGSLIKQSNVEFYQYANLSENPDDISGGYLVELDNLYYSRESAYFGTDIGNSYVVKSPEYASKEEVEYIAKLFADFEEALYSPTGYNKAGRHYTEYCDLESLCKIYVVNEACKNWDSYKGSTYFYVDADKNGVTSKIYMGPVWDFDNSYGTFNSGHFHTDYTELWAEGNNGSGSYKNDFGAKLKQHPEALKLISDYYAQASEILKSMYEDGGIVDQMAKMLLPGVAMDRSKWGIKGRLSAFFVYDVYSDGKDQTTDTAIGYLKNFMKLRNEGLLEKLCGYMLSEDYYEIQIESKNAVLTSAYFKAGEAASVKLKKADCVLEIYDGAGNLVPSETRDGYCYFTMPSGSVTVREGTYVPPETTETTETEVTETTETQPVTTTETEEVTTNTEEISTVEETEVTETETVEETDIETTESAEETTEETKKGGLPIVWAITVVICVIAGIIATVIVIVHSRRKNSHEG